MLSAIFVADRRRSGGDNPVEDVCQTHGYRVYPDAYAGCRGPVRSGRSRSPPPLVPGRLNSEWAEGSGRLQRLATSWRSRRCPHLRSTCIVGADVVH